MGRYDVPGASGGSFDLFLLSGFILGETATFVLESAPTATGFISSQARSYPPVFFVRFFLFSFYRFDHLDFLFQQRIHYLAERYTFLSHTFGEVTLDVGVQIDRQAKDSVGTIEFAAFPFAEIIFRLHRCSVIADFRLCGPSRRNQPDSCPLAGQRLKGVDHFHVAAGRVFSADPFLPMPTARSNAFVPAIVNICRIMLPRSIGPPLWLRSL